MGRSETVKRACVLARAVEISSAAATWLMQRGVPIWQAAGFLGMSTKMLERTYGHHHPDHMRTAAQAITSKQPQNVSLVVSLVDAQNGRRKRQKIWELVVADAVAVEPVSTPKFPANREKSREFR